MNISDIGASGKILLVGLCLMLFGALLLVAEPDTGSTEGTPLFLFALLFLVPGAIISTVALIGGGAAKIYGALDDNTKRYVRWGALIVIVCLYGGTTVNRYLESRPAAIAARAEQQQKAEQDAHEKREATLEALIGGWVNGEGDSNFLVFDAQGATYTMQDQTVTVVGTWSIKNRESSSTPIIIRKASGWSLIKDVHQHKVLAAGPTQLVLKYVSDDYPDRKYKPETFRRVTDLAAHRLTNLAFGYLKSIPVVPETNTLPVQSMDGINHWFYAQPVTVVNGGDEITAGPGWDFERMKIVSKGDPVTLLAVTDITFRDYPWFLVRTSEGVEGYQLGGSLCAREAWIQGVHHFCPVTFIPRDRFGNPLEIALAR